MNQNNSCRIQELKQLVEYGTGSARPNVAGHSQWQSRRPYRWCNWYGRSAVEQFHVKYFVNNSRGSMTA